MFNNILFETSRSSQSVAPAPSRAPRRELKVGAPPAPEPMSGTGPETIVAIADSLQTQHPKGMVVT